jgi:hypothetical protein
MLQDLPPSSNSAVRATVLQAPFVRRLAIGTRLSSCVRPDYLLAEESLARTGNGDDGWWWPHPI